MTHIDSHASPPSERRLDNGLQVILQPDPQIPVVALALQYNVGSRDETPGASGRAHLFEHLMFQGTQRVPASTHLQRINDVGGSANASTSSSATRYHAVLPTEHAALGLWLEADRMEGLAVTEDSFRMQLAAVIEERGQRVDDAPYGRAMEEFEARSFANWAQGHPTIGSRADLDAATLPEVMDFHSRWYRPDNAALSIVGDFDPDELTAHVEAWFGGITAGGDRTRADLSEPPRSGPDHATVDDPLARLPALLLNHQAPAVGSPLAAACEVLEGVLFRGAAARLQRALVIETSAAIQLGGGYDARTGPGLFGLSAVIPQDGDYQYIVDTWMRALETLANEPISDDELLRTRQPLLAGHLFALESPLTRALGFSDGALLHGDPTWHQTYLEAVSEVEPAHIQAAAQLLLQSPPVSMLVRPQERS